MDIIESRLYTKPSDPSLKLVNADFSDDFGLLALLTQETSYLVQLEESQLYFDSTKFACLLFFIRWIGSDRFLLAGMGEDEHLPTIYIVNRQGIIQDAFYGGDKVEDVTVSKEGIWVSYFDEGVFGRGISTEGLVLFSHSGAKKFRYTSDLLVKPEISDCYAICKGKSSTLWLFPYSDFPLLCVNPLDRTYKSYEVPKLLHGAHAICVRGNTAYFHGGYISSDDLYSWQIGSTLPTLLGEFKGFLRGLSPKESAHFISTDEITVKTYTIINDEEYTYK